MKTDDLVLMLATGAESVDTHFVAKRFTIALGYGLLGAFVLMLGTIGLLADLSTVLTTPKFWVKFTFVVCLAVAGMVVTYRLSIPGTSLGQMPVLLGLPVIILWMVALNNLMQVDTAQRLVLVLGETWTTCAALIAMLSLPVFIAVVWAVRGLAPTRLRLAGGSAGVLSGAVGACVYCMHCPEMEAPFVATWYIAGILVPAIVGFLLGPRLMRW